MSKASRAVQAASDLYVVRKFIGTSQKLCIRDCIRGEEADWFIDKLAELANTIKTMPKTYEQDGLGENAVAHLHYFTGGCDWYITERDIDQDGEGQIQAFGYANLGYGAELGYISIKELIEADVEIDLHFKPKTLAEIAGKEPEIDETATCPDCNATPSGPVPAYCHKHDGDYSSWLVSNNID